MPEPLIPTAGAGALIAGSAATLPVLQVVPTIAPEIVVAGLAIGLRADVLLAGFFGSVVALAFFNAVPSTGDGWQELLRTTCKRMAFCLASSVTAGYLTPLVLLGGNPTATALLGPLLLPMAFLVGVGAQGFLGRYLRRAQRGELAVQRMLGAGQEGDE